MVDKILTAPAGGPPRRGGPRRGAPPGGTLEPGPALSAPPPPTTPRPATGGGACPMGRAAVGDTLCTVYPPRWRLSCGARRYVGYIMHHHGGKIGAAHEPPLPGVRARRATSAPAHTHNTHLGRRATPCSLDLILLSRGAALNQHQRPHPLWRPTAPVVPNTGSTCVGVCVCAQGPGNRTCGNAAWLRCAPAACEFCGRRVRWDHRSDMEGLGGGAALETPTQRMAPRAP